MNGKQHGTIGVVAGVGYGLALSAKQFSNLGSNASVKEVIALSATVVTTVAAPLVIGSFIGSFAPDIDSKKSKAAQLFNKIVMSLVLALGVSYYLDLPVLSKVMGLVKDTAMGNFGLLLFIVNVVLGKLSSHRGYTHRWIGTSVAIVSAFMAFDKMFAVGYAIGYLLHIAADRTTADGKNLKFFKVHLPMTNSKGKFHPVF